MRRQSGRQNGKALKVREREPRQMGCLSADLGGDLGLKLIIGSEKGGFQHKKPASRACQAQKVRAKIRGSLRFVLGVPMKISKRSLCTRS